MAGPVTTRGNGFLELRPSEMVLQGLTLQGPRIWLDARGFLRRDSEANLHLKGGVDRQVLEWLHVDRSSQETINSAWEPFELELKGMTAHPSFSFQSNFFSTSFNGEHKP